MSRGFSLGWVGYFRGIWFDCFLFLFLVKTENGDENMFNWIFKNIFNENKRQETIRK